MRAFRPRFVLLLALSIFVILSIWPVTEAAEPKKGKASAAKSGKSVAAPKKGKSTAPAKKGKSVQPIPSENVKPVVAKKGKSVAKKGGKSVAKKGGKSVAKKGGKSVAKKGGKSVAKKGGKSVAKKGGKSVAKKGGKSVAKKGGKSVAKKGGKSVAKKGGKSVAKKGGKSVAKKGKTAQKKGKSAAAGVEGSPDLASSANDTRHDLFMVTVQSEDILTDFHAAQFNLWAPPRKYLNGKTKLMVLTKTQKERDEINAWLTKHDLPFELLQNVEKKEKKKGKSILPLGEINWTAYHNLETVNAWLDKVCRTFEKTVSCEMIGKSVEGRPIRLIKITNGDKKPKKQAWIDSIHHAREWITLSFSTFVINELTKNAEKYRSILNKYDIYVVPLVNPDGYAYTHAKPENRMWRKNRRLHPKGKENDDCNGVDLNRNYAFKFQYGPDGEGFSSDPCEESYSGTSAFSEPESTAMRDAILKQKGKIEFYFTIHAFGQVMMYAWGYAKEKLEDDEDVERIANCTTEAIRGVYGTDYKSGSSNWVYIYPTSGGTDDWVVAEAGVRKTYTFELRDSQEGKFGFLLPEDQILPSVTETWVGLQVALTDCNSTAYDQDDFYLDLQAGDGEGSLPLGIPKKKGKSIVKKGKSAILPQAKKGKSAIQPQAKKGKSAILPQAKKGKSAIQPQAKKGKSAIQPQAKKGKSASPLESFVVKDKDATYEVGKKGRTATLSITKHGKTAIYALASGSKKGKGIFGSKKGKSISPFGLKKGKSFASGQVQMGSPNSVRAPSAGMQRLKKFVHTRIMDDDDDP